MRPAFDYIEEHEMNVDSCVVLSDLYLSSRNIEEPDYPVLWVTTGSKDAPFGEVVEVS
jgi:predicted metal-dependent peptidase